MEKQKTTPKKNDVTYFVERVYVGEKPMNEVFEKVIEHIVNENIKNENRNKVHA